MEIQLYSIRMRAARAGMHISGAERLVPADALAATSAALTERALQHPRGTPDAVRISIDGIPAASIVRAALPDVTTVRVADLAAGRAAALAELQRAGVATAVAAATLAQLAAGANPAGGPLRGAMLVDADSGARLDPVPERGVRASRMDLTPAAAARLRELLAARGLDNEHVREALVLAGKVRMLPGFVAELCWSDDPDYTAGYVCTQTRGYVRFPQLKALGDPNGGRAFFVRQDVATPEEALAFLQRTPVLFERLGTLHPDEEWPG